MDSFRTRIDVEALAAACDRANQSHEDLTQILTSAVEGHLAALNAEGRLVPSEDLGAREIRFIRAWNALAGGTASEWERRDIVNDLVMGATTIALFNDAAAVVDMLTAMFDEGNSPVGRNALFRMIEATDSFTGERGEIRLEGFSPSFWALDPTVPGGYRRAARLEPLGAVAVEITAPGGELLFTDSLRVGDFNDATDFEPAREYGALSLNSATGRQARILAHAEEHNFGFVQTDNTCVSVFQNEATGALIVTERWNEDVQIDANGEYQDEISLAGWKRLGSFSCDVWRVTAIDRAVAAALIAPGDAKAGEEALAAYLASGDCYAEDVVAVPVAAGSRWRITCGEGFNAALDRQALGLPAELAVWALYELVS